jgi:hypothetical protein
LIEHRERVQPKKRRKKGEKRADKKKSKGSRKEKKRRHASKKRSEKKKHRKKKSKHAHSSSSDSSHSSSSSSDEGPTFYVEDCEGNANLPFMDIRVDVPAYNKPRRSHRRQPIGFSLLSPYEKTLALQASQVSSSSRDKNDGRYFTSAMFRYMNDGSMKRLRMAYSERRLRKKEEGGVEEGRKSKFAIVNMSTSQLFIPLRPVVQVGKTGEWMDTEWDPDSEDDSEGEDDESAFSYTPGLSTTNAKNKLRKAQSLATESESIESMLARRTRELNEEAIQNPKDIGCWLALAAFQEEVLRHHPNRQTAKLVAQKQVAIFERGLRHLPENSMLLRGRLAASSFFEPPDAMGKLWENTLAFNGTDLNLWKHWMQFQNKAKQQALSAAYSIDSMRETALSSFDGMYIALAAASHSGSSGGRRPVLQLRGQYQVLGLVRKACALEVEAGFTERAIAILQALIEFNMGRPRSTSSDVPMSSETMSNFELFWESEYCRIGESGPPRNGWSAWYGETLVGKRALAEWDKSHDPQSQQDTGVETEASASEFLSEDVAAKEVRRSVIQPILQDLEKQLESLDELPKSEATKGGQWHTVVDPTETEAVTLPFEDWCVPQLQALLGREVNSDDVGLLQFCMTVDDPDDVREYFGDNWGKTREVSEFAAGFLEKRGLKLSTGLFGEQALGDEGTGGCSLEAQNAGDVAASPSPSKVDKGSLKRKQSTSFDDINSTEIKSEVKKEKKKKSSSFHKKAKKAKKRAEELVQLGRPDPKEDTGPRTFYSIVHGFHIELDDDSVTQEMYDKILNELATGESALDSESAKRKLASKGRGRSKNGGGGAAGSQSEDDDEESSIVVSRDDAFTSWLSKEDDLSQVQWKPLKMLGENGDGTCELGCDSIDIEARYCCHVL